MVMIRETAEPLIKCMPVRLESSVMAQLQRPSCEFQDRRDTNYLFALLNWVEVVAAWQN